jgi:hypothetical protein
MACKFCRLFRQTGAIIFGFAAFLALRFALAALRAFSPMHRIIEFEYVTAFVAFPPGSSSAAATAFVT